MKLCHINCSVPVFYRHTVYTGAHTSRKGKLQCTIIYQSYPATKNTSLTVSQLRIWQRDNFKIVVQNLPNKATSYTWVWFLSKCWRIMHKKSETEIESIGRRADGQKGESRNCCNCINSAWVKFSEVSTSRRKYSPITKFNKEERKKFKFCWRRSVWQWAVECKLWAGEDEPETVDSVKNFW